MTDDYHVFDYDLGKNILNDLTILIAQVGLVYTLTQKEPFAT